LDNIIFKALLIPYNMSVFQSWLASIFFIQRR